MLEIIEQTGTIDLGDGKSIGITIQKPNIDSERARAVFDKGQDIGDWGWKHKRWAFPQMGIASLDELLAAICFFYGLHMEGPDKNVKIFGAGEYTIVDAWYAC